MQITQHKQPKKNDYKQNQYDNIDTQVQAKRSSKNNKAIACQGLGKFVSWLIVNGYKLNINIFSCRL